MSEREYHERQRQLAMANALAEYEAQRKSGGSIHWSDAPNPLAAENARLRTLLEEAASESESCPHCCNADWLSRYQASKETKSVL